MPAEILIDIKQCKLHLKQEGKVINVYPVAVGAPKTPSPVGVYTISNKAYWGGAFGTRWMQLSVPWGTYGIHGTNRPDSIGCPVSHGCIRMHNKDVEEVYAQVDIGTQVTLEGSVFYRLCVNGSRGNLVTLIQQSLHQLGFHDGVYDGIFDARTEKAVCRWQKENNYPVTGQINKNDLFNLGVVIN